MGNGVQRIGLLTGAVALAIAIEVATVGGRGPEPRVDELPSETAPARTPRPPVVGGGSVEAAPFEEAGVAPRDLITPRAEASAVVTSQALTATVTAYLAIDPAPATPAAPTSEPTAVAGLPPPPASSYEALARAAIASAFPPSEQATAYRVAWCETHGTFDPTSVGKAGEQGIFQVMAVYHGPVPADIEGQARQAAGIVAAHGWSPWSCY